MLSYVEVDDDVYKIYSWPDVVLFIDNSAFTGALPMGSYVD